MWLLERLAALLLALALPGFAAVTQQVLGLNDALSSGFFNSKFNKRVEELLQHFHVPAVSIAVVNGNKTFAKGYGTAVLPDTPAVPETLYYTGSTTKSFTAASILKLIEDSSNHSTPITLGTKIQSLIRNDFVLQDDYATAHVTLEDALSHRTGMPRHDASYGEPNATLQRMIQRMRYLPMTGEIRQEWHYCNMMFSVLSYTIETLTNTWLGDFFRQHIWKPLGMHSTFLSLSEAKQAALTRGAPLSRGYFWNNLTGEYVVEPYLDSPLITGAGATISNVLDYAGYLRAMLQMNPAILSESSYKELRSPRMFSNPHYGENAPWTGPEMYGLGWMMSNYHGHQVFHHGGSVRGYGALMAYVPTIGDGFGIVAMANTELTSNCVIQILVFHVMDDVLDTPSDEREDWVPRCDAMLAKRSANLKLDEARNRIFPDAPEGDDALPLPLPLDGYAGSYWNDGYRNISIYVDDHPDGKLRSLRADVLDKVWQHSISFQHVSGNYFLARMHAPGRDLSDGYMMDGVIAAEFRVGPSGKVEGFGIDYESSMKGDKIWFTRQSV